MNELNQKIQKSGAGRKGVAKALMTSPTPATPTTPSTDDLPTSEALPCITKRRTKGPNGRRLPTTPTTPSTPDPTSADAHPPRCDACDVTVDDPFNASWFLNDVVTSPTPPTPAVKKTGGKPRTGVSACCVF